MKDYTIAQLLETFPLNTAALARELGIARHQLYYYTKDGAYISAERRQLIEDAVRELGKRLAEVHLV